MAEPILWGNVVTKPLSATTSKFKGYLVPEYFSASFYFLDNDGLKVTTTNVKRFKKWRVDLTLRVSSNPEQVEIIDLQAHGAYNYTSQTIILLESPQATFDRTLKFEPLQARHIEALHTYRVKLISFAIQALIQSVKVKKNGSYSFETTQVPASDLEDINDSIFATGYTKLGASFYKQFAERYKEQVLGGEKYPIKALNALYYPDKSAKQVQAYATEARKRGLIAKAEQGKNSPIRKQRKVGK